jgi:hypothetical protein
VGRGDARFYSPEGKPGLVLGPHEQVLHPEACACMEPPDTMRRRHRQKGSSTLRRYIFSQLVEGDAVPRCNGVRRCGADIVFDLAWPHFLRVEGHRPDGGIAGHHPPHVGSERWDKWVSVYHNYTVRS